MKWLWLLLHDPGRALDWYNGAGHYDHAKVVPDLVLFALVVLQLVVGFSTMKLPPMGWGIIDLSAAFGYGAWRAFLRSRTVTSEEVIVSSDEKPFGPAAWLYDDDAR